MGGMYRLKVDRTEKGAGSMKKVVLSVVAALALSAAPALAADMPTKAKVVVPAAAPSPWDIAFGTAFTTDYMLRGVSQSAHKPAVQGYFEGRYTFNDMITIYAGIWGSSLYTGFANAEFDLSGGVRFTFGNFGLDLGYVYYDYPDGTVNGFGSFGEFYAKPTYKFNDWLTIGAILDGGDNFNNKLTLAPPWVGNGTAYYYSANAVITLPWKPHPDVTISINPEIGRQFFGSGPNTNLLVASYTYWDVGLDFNYKAVTLDLRYWDTNTSNATNAICVVNLHPGMDACSPRFVATLKFDTTFAALK
jgi:uncharacterized protein (TIGR02001 family)